MIAFYILLEKEIFVPIQMCQLLEIVDFLISLCRKLFSHWYAFFLFFYIRPWTIVYFLCLAYLILDFTKFSWDNTQRCSFYLGILSYCNVFQKQPFRGVFEKRCSENMEQIYSRKPMPKCHFNKVANDFIEMTLLCASSPVELLHIFWTPFLKDTSGWLLLVFF